MTDMQAAPAPGAGVGAVVGTFGADTVVSVIVPCFNAAPYIAAALDSIVAQDVDGLEIIVVDDGSVDDSVQRAQQACPQARVIRQANAGVAAARNAGIAAARGNWLAFLDADDIWLPGKLQAQLDLLARHPEARMCYAAWHVWTSDNVLPEPVLLQRLADSAAAAADPGPWSGPSGWIYPDLLLDCVVWTSTVVLHRDLIAQVGGFDVQRRIGEDYDLWLRLSRITPILRLARPAALYRMHPASITRGAPARNDRGEVVASALARWGYRSPDGRLADAGTVARMLARSWSDHAGANLMAGRPALARHGALHALRVDPLHWPGWKVYLKSLVSGFRPPPARDG